MLASGAEEQVQEYIDLLYNQSLLLEGSKIKDPAAFARSVVKLMTGKAKGRDAA
jgi:HSP90 family molecular chaperone